jgi:hypothetical protein
VRAGIRDERRRSRAEWRSARRVERGRLRRAAEANRAPAGVPRYSDEQT